MDTRLGAAAAGPTLSESRHLSEGNPDGGDAQDMLMAAPHIRRCKKKEPVKRGLTTCFGARQKDGCKVWRQPAACTVHGQAQKRPAGSVYIRAGSKGSLRKQCCQTGPV